MPVVYADVDSVLAALASIESTFTVVPDTLPSSTSPDERPDSLPETDLPRWVNLPGPAIDAWTQGNDEEGWEGFETREYRCCLYVAPVGDGTSGESVDLVRRYFRPGVELFMQHQTLGGLAGVQGVRVLGDGGMAESLYAKEPFWTITFRVQITTRVRITYAAFE